MTPRRAAALAGLVAFAVVAVLWARQPVASPSPRVAPTTGQPAPPSRALPPAPPPAAPPVQGPATRYVPPGGPPVAIDVSDMLPGKEAHELEAADTGLVVDAAKMRAAQLHLIPPADVPLLPLDADTVDATLAELTPKMARCLGPDGAEPGATVELLLGPILDGTKNLLQVTELPEGHPDPTTLACLTEVVRSAPFEHGPPSTMTIDLGER